MHTKILSLSKDTQIANAQFFESLINKMKVKAPKNKTILLRVLFSSFGFSSFQNKDITFTSKLNFFLTRKRIFAMKKPQQNINKQKNPTNQNKTTLSRTH